MKKVVFTIDNIEYLKREYKLSDEQAAELFREMESFKDIYTTAAKEYKNQVHTRSLHAEENAFLQLAKYGTQGIQNGVLFTTASCCELCAKKAYQLGIKKIYYIDMLNTIS